MKYDLKHPHVIFCRSLTVTSKAVTLTVGLVRRVEERVEFIAARGTSTTLVSAQTPSVSTCLVSTAVVPCHDVIQTRWLFAETWRVFVAVLEQISCSWTQRSRPVTPGHRGADQLLLDTEEHNVHWLQLLLDTEENNVHWLQLRCFKFKTFSISSYYKF